MRAHALFVCVAVLMFASQVTSSAKTSKPFFFVVGGTIGSFSTQATSLEFVLENVVLAEWDMERDRPIAGGACLQAERLQLAGVPGR